MTTSWTTPLPSTTVDCATTPAWLDRRARETPDHAALVTGDRSFTFSELRDEVRRTAAAMIARGVRTGDHVAIWSTNTWHWVVAALATHYAGAVLVPVNTGYTGREVEDILARTRASVLFAMTELGGVDPIGNLDRTALPALGHIVCIPLPDSTAAAGPGCSTWADFCSGARAPMREVDARAAAVCPDDISDILFTSGTTGRSKGVVCTHRQSLAASASWAQTGTLSAADRYLCVNPFFHNFGYKAGILACLQTGATLVPQQSFDPERSMRTIQDLQITVLPGPPTLYQALLDHPARSRYNLASLRFVVTGAAMVPVVLIERIQRELDIDIVLTAYGLTEASGFGTMCRPGDDPVTVATTCGRPIADFEIRIANPDSSGAGEVLLRGPNVMVGYLDDPAATAEAIDVDGWLHTGDVGVLDEAGNLTITDRLTDKYISGGLNVYPAEVEQTLAQIEQIASAAVIGVPDERLGSVGCAFVVLRPGCTLDEQSVIAHTRAQLAGFKAPRSVVFLDSLPRNAAGKVLKNLLRHTHARSAVPTAGLTPGGLGGPPFGTVENWIADAWQTLLSIDRPGRLDRFTDLGGNSLSAVELSLMLQQQFGVTMSIDRFASQPTIAALAQDLQGGGHRRQPVVELRHDGEGPIFIMVPGYGGHAWVYSRLAAALTGPCDVLAISPIDLAERRPSQSRVEIRNATLAAIEGRGRSGRPIVLAGYSFGSLIAVDLACWLAGRSVDVDHVVLIDPHPIDSRRPARSPRTRLREMLQMRSPRTFLAVRRWRHRDTAGSRIEDAVLRPEQSQAVRKLEEDVERFSAHLRNAYLDGSIWLPDIPVSMVQSEQKVDEFRSATAVFGTPIERVATRVLEGLDHRALMEDSHGVGRLAEWVDQISFGGHDVAPVARDLSQIHLRRLGFDPAPELAEVRSSTGVQVLRTPFGASAYVLTRYDDVKMMLADHERFSTSPPWITSDPRSLQTGPTDELRAGNLMVLDPPAHTRLRRMLAGQFTARRMKFLQQRITEIVNDRLSAMERAGGPLDLVENFALPIPSLVICELLGVPYGDRAEFQRRGVREFDMNISMDERATIARESRDYMAGLVAGARRSPGSDILGMLVREHGAELTDAELTGMASLLLLAGHDTTANTVEELLRWLSILQTGQTRFTTTDVEVSGVVIPARQPVYASMPAANRDPRFIDDPDSLDIRRGATGHLAFGHGIHHCLGAPLARMQMSIALPALLRRFPGLALAEPFDEVSFRTFHFIFGLGSLEVTW